MAKERIKITDEQRAEVVRLWKEGLTYIKISERTGISRSTVGHIILHANREQTEKEPAPAEAGQALTGNYNTNNIAQSSEVVNSFIEFLPILINLAEQHFGDIKILTVDGNDISGGSFKLAGIRFENGDGWRYRLLVEASKRGEES